MAGLRERNKARTRADIQRHALRLFREQGYANTTVEQIAKAAEISQSTFFRYFPTKEDVLLQDEYDSLLMVAFRHKPPDMSPVQAIRQSMREVFAQVPAEHQAYEWERMCLSLSVPEVRARVLDGFYDAIGMLAELLAERLGRPRDDLAIRAYAGALAGVIIAVPLDRARDMTEYLALLDEALGHFEAGPPF